MKSLEEVTAELKKVKEAKRMRDYRAKYPERKKKANAKWNAENRNDYQKAYYKKKKLKS